MAAYESGRLQYLSGIRFDVCFGAEIGRPPKTIDHEVFEQLINVFERAVWIPRWRELGPFPEGWVGELADGSIQWQLSGVSDGPFRDSMLANRSGFEVEFRISETKLDVDLLQQMHQTIAEKDVAVNRELLIVAGGPTMRGRVFHAGVHLGLRAAELWKGPAPRPTHLRRVFLDVWGAEKLFLLFEA